SAGPPRRSAHPARRSVEGAHRAAGRIASLSASEGSRGTRSARRGEITVSLAPLDNRALANLCGPVDANLRQIEAVYDVAIARRGATFTLRGAPSQAEQAGSAPPRFHARA